MLEVLATGLVWQCLRKGSFCLNFNSQDANVVADGVSSPTRTVGKGIMGAMITSTDVVVDNMARTHST